MAPHPAARKLLEISDLNRQCLIQQPPSETNLSHSLRVTHLKSTNLNQKVRTCMSHLVDKFNTPTRIPRQFPALPTDPPRLTTLARFPYHVISIQPFGAVPDAPLRALMSTTTSVWSGTSI